MASLKSLEEALKEILKDDSKISRFVAKAIKELILADGRVSAEERTFLERALNDNVFDDKAFEILQDLLLRDDMKNV
ncbi:MAG: hypothetical protein K2X77_05950 [Candidatus Obscuribacterales bacterium]|nr:hypothetical protein [Candidatus Obscuribacterales bacterium]